MSFLGGETYCSNFAKSLKLNYHVTCNMCLFMYVSFASIMNLFGVLKYKKMGEDFLRESGLPFTIIRFGIKDCFKMESTYVLLIFTVS